MLGLLGGRVWQGVAGGAEREGGGGDVQVCWERRECVRKVANVSEYKTRVDRISGQRIGKKWGCGQRMAKSKFL